MQTCSVEGMPAFFCCLQTRVSQPWHCWHCGWDDSLLWGAVLGTAGCLTGCAPSAHVPWQLQPGVPCSRTTTQNQGSVLGGECEHEIMVLMRVNGARKGPCVPWSGVRIILPIFIRSQSRGKLWEFRSLNSFGWSGNDLCHRVSLFPISVQERICLNLFIALKLNLFLSPNLSSPFYFTLMLWLKTTITTAVIILPCQINFYLTSKSKNGPLLGLQRMTVSFAPCFLLENANIMDTFP